MRPTMTQCKGNMIDRLCRAQDIAHHFISPNHTFRGSPHQNIGSRARASHVNTRHLRRYCLKTPSASHIHNHSYNASLHPRLSAQSSERVASCTALRRHVHFLSDPSRPMQVSRHSSLTGGYTATKPINYMKLSKKITR
jgi:hypothetical protein